MVLKRQGVLDGTYGARAEEKKQTPTPSPKNNSVPAPPLESTPPPENSLQHREELAAAPIEAPADVASAPVAAASALIPGRAGAATSSPTAPASPPAPMRTVARTRRAQQRDDELAREAVTEAYMSAKRRPKEWTGTAIRLAAPVKERLAQRRALDEESFDVKFAETHYIDAALSRVPDDPESAIAWVNEYLDGLGLKAPETTGTTGRVRQTTATHLATVFRKMRQQAGYGMNGHLQTAAVARLLDALDRRDAELQAQGAAIDLD